MLVLDDALLGDYLDGKPRARAFLEGYEEEAWAVPVPVLYGACMASLHGYIDGSPETVRRAVMTSMDVLDVTGRTVAEAVGLQAELLERGVPAAPPDVLVAASARTRGHARDRRGALPAGGGARGTRGGGVRAVLSRVVRRGRSSVAVVSGST